MSTQSTEAELRQEIARIAQEQERLVFSSFSHDDAWRLGSILVGLARDRDLPIAIDISRGDQQVFHVGLTGSSANNDGWIERKKRTTRLFGHSTLLLRLRSELPGGQGIEWLDPGLFVLAGGCFPIMVAGGAMVGMATVSGLPDVADHALVVESIETFLAA